MQLREQWTDRLDPVNKLSEWSRDEDWRLFLGVQQHGQQKWAMIAKSLPGRGDGACRRRWHVFPPDRFEEFRDVYEVSVVAHDLLNCVACSVVSCPDLM